jgi:hypothetical protein
VAGPERLVTIPGATCGSLTTAVFRWLATPRLPMFTTATIRSREPVTIRPGICQLSNSGPTGPTGVEPIGATSSVPEYSVTKTEKRKQISPRPVSPATDPAQVAFGETAGLFPQPKKNVPIHVSIYNRYYWDPESLIQLQTARRNIADVSRRNHKVYSKLPGKDLISQMIWDTVKWAVVGADGSLPGNLFFIRQAGVGPQKPEDANPVLDSVKVIRFALMAHLETLAEAMLPNEPRLSSISMFSRRATYAVLSLMILFGPPSVVADSSVEEVVRNLGRGTSEIDQIRALAREPSASAKVLINELHVVPDKRLLIG